MLTLTWMNWINLTLLILAHLNTWRPITFRWLGGIATLYIYPVRFLAIAVVAFRYVRQFKRKPSEAYLYSVVFGDGPPESVRIQYRTNLASYLLYAALLWLFLL